MCQSPHRTFLYSAVSPPLLIIIIIIINSTPASSLLDEGETVEDSYGPSHYAQREDGKRDSGLLDSRIEQARLGAIPLGVN